MATKKKPAKKAAKKPAPKVAGPRARQVAGEWIEENALRVGAAAAIPTPIPGAHTVLTTALEAYMIIAIGRIYGRRLTPGEAVALIPTLGAGIVVGKTASAIAGEVLGWVPIIGWAAKGAASGATAYGIGKAAIVYFESESPGAPAAPFEMVSIKKFVTDFFANASLVKKAQTVKAAPAKDEGEEEESEEEDDEELDEDEDEDEDEQDSDAND
jgi:uncharacterized protein (DUF697 family)